MERAMEDGNLLLAFGDFQRNDKAGEEIGRRIVSALSKKGFQTDWSGSIERRIEVIGLKWQKRFGNDCCSLERAFTLLSKRS